MKEITKYKAEDGLEFNDKVECVEHERSCIMVSIIMERLPNRPDDCSFTNGSGYIQHGSNLLEVRNDFLRFVSKQYNITHKWVEQTINKGFEVHPSYVGRLIGECCPNTISKHWYRFMCIDSKLREWGQPYYANNPHEADQVVLNGDG